MNTYHVTVALEQNFRHGEPCWVARDSNGSWRAYAVESLATHPIAAVVAMFHPVEIVRIVRIDRSKARAVIEGS